MTKRYIRTIAFCAAITLLDSCSLFASSHHRTEDYTAVVAAADACDLAKVQSAVDQEPQLLRATEWDNATLLHDAVGHNCETLVTYLLDKGADVNAVKADGVTPLHIAAQRGNIGIAALLLNHGAKINATDSKGWTPLDRAEKWDHPNVATFLRQHGGHKGAAGN